MGKKYGNYMTSYVIRSPSDPNRNGRHSTFYRFPGL